MAERGRILVCGTPIGNAADAGRRLAAVLATADVVAAEDTRRLRRLAATLGIDLGARVVSYYDAVEARRVPELLAAARAGSTVALVTDAGMPAVSDPGYRLVAAAAAAGIPVSVSPGTQRSHGGAGGQRAAQRPVGVRGFPAAPRGRARRARLDDLAAERRTIVLLEAPHRVAAALADLVAVFGARAGTRSFAASSPRRTRRSSEAGWGSWPPGRTSARCSARSPWWSRERRRARSVPSADELRDAVDALVRTGLSRRDAVAAVARDRNLPRRLVYSAAVTGSDT